MLITGEIQLSMHSRPSRQDDKLLGQIYSHFLALRVSLDELRHIESTHRMIEGTHELTISLEALDRIIETVETGHEMYKAYWYRGDLRHQIQEIMDKHNA